ATEGTVRSRAYDAASADFDGDTERTSDPCTDFVNRIESGDYGKHPRTEQVIPKKPEAYRDTGCHTIIKCSTHFPLIQQARSAFFHDEKHREDAGFEPVNIDFSQLHRNDLLHTHKEPPKHTFFVHGQNDTFESILNTWIPNI